MEARSETGDQEIDELLEEEESNPRLENFLSNYTGSFSEGVLVAPLQDRQCNLCGIPEDPEENIFVSEDENYGDSVGEAVLQRFYEAALRD
jgi:hypothetical protein